MNSTSVKRPVRRHRRAYRNTHSMLLITRFHQNQLPAIPVVRTIPVTASGVSAANVVATIDVPASHHGRLRPESRKSAMLLPALRASSTPIPNATTQYATTMTQSMLCMPES